MKSSCKQGADHIAGCGAGRSATPPVTPGVPRDAGTVLPVIFDDDGSQDGTAALAYLLSHPGVSIRAITVSYGKAHPTGRRLSMKAALRTSKCASPRMPAA